MFLDDGVLICNLANKVNDAEIEWLKRGEESRMKPSTPPKPQTTRGQDAIARDNALRFIHWCKKFGIHEAVLFGAADIGPVFF